MIALFSGENHGFYSILTIDMKKIKIKTINALIFYNRRTNIDSNFTYDYYHYIYLSCFKKKKKIYTTIMKVTLTLTTALYDHKYFLILKFKIFKKISALVNKM